MLFIDFVYCFLWCLNVLYFVEGVYVEWKVVYCFFVVGYWVVSIMVKGCELVNVILDFFIGSVENVGFVLVYLDFINFFGEDVFGDVIMFFNYFYLFVMFGSFVSKGGIE